MLRVSPTAIPANLALQISRFPGLRSCGSVTPLADDALCFPLACHNSLLPFATSH
uniref:Uncharacterized protein n=1 Tax=Setaria italica TaxID=4555 RepID=K4ANE3_SETIT